MTIIYNRRNTTLNIKAYKPQFTSCFVVCVLHQEHKLEDLTNLMLRKIFKPKNYEVNSLGIYSLCGIALKLFFFCFCFCLGAVP